MATKKTGKAAPKKAAKKKVKAAAADKTERVANNGIPQPREGTTAHTVFTLADNITAKLGSTAPRKDVLEAAEKKSINAATASTQYGRWRKYNGLEGRLTAAE